MVGFSDRVDLGQMGILRNDPSIALRFTLDDLGDSPPARVTLRLRGTAFDSYDGRAWRRTLSDHVAAPHSQERYPIYRLPDPAHDRRITFDLEPIDPPVLFLPPRTVGLQVRSQGQAGAGEPLSILRGPEGELRYGGEGARGLHYEAFLAGEQEGLAEPLAANERPRYLTLANDLPTRIADLAHAWTDKVPSSFAKAKGPSKTTSATTFTTTRILRPGERDSRWMISSSYPSGDTASSSRQRWPSCCATSASPHAT